MAKVRITIKDQRDAQKLMDAIDPIEGEMRVINKCSECGQLFGRRFIPFGLGYGASYNMCLCQLTSRNVRYIAVLESRD